MSKKLYRSRTDSKIAGVCGGLGEYFDIDPTIIRIVAVLLIFADGIGLLAYIIAWIAMPQRPLATTEVHIQKPESEQGKEKNSSVSLLIPGIILIALGIFFLFENFYWWFDFGSFFWPVLLIAIGIFLIIGRRNSHETASDNNGTAEVKS